MHTMERIGQAQQPVGMVCINELPEELLTSIFLFISKEQDITNSRLVCRKWNRIARELHFLFLTNKMLAYWANRVDPKFNRLAALSFHKAMERRREGQEPIWRDLEWPLGHNNKCFEYRWARLHDGQDLLVGLLSQTERQASTICSWTLPQGELSIHHSVDEYELRQLRIMPEKNGSLLMAAAGKGRVYVWDLTTWEKICRIEVGSEFCKLAAIRVGGKWRLITSATENGKTSVWNATSGKLIAQLDIGGRGIDLVEGYWRSQHCLFASNRAGEVSIWDLENGAMIKRLFEGSGRDGGNAIAWLPDRLGGGKVVIYHFDTMEIRSADIISGAVNSKSFYSGNNCWIRRNGDGFVVGNRKSRNVLSEDFSRLDKGEYGVNVTVLNCNSNCQATSENDPLAT